MRCVINIINSFNLKRADAAIIRQIVLEEVKKNWKIISEMKRNGSEQNAWKVERKYTEKAVSN